MQILVNPAREPKDWTYGLMYEGAAGKLPLFFYEADFFAQLDTGLVYSKGRIFRANSDADRFLDVYPSPYVVAVTAVQGNAGPDPLILSLFFEEPLGFALYGGTQGSGSVPLEMQALVCRLLVALLGKPGYGYVKTPVNTRERFGLDLA